MVSYKGPREEREGQEQHAERLGLSKLQAQRQSALSPKIKQLLPCSALLSNLAIRGLNYGL